MLLSTEAQPDFIAQVFPRSVLFDYARLDTPITGNMSFRLFSSDKSEAVVAGERHTDLEANQRFQLHSEILRSLSPFPFQTSAFPGAVF